MVNFTGVKHSVAELAHRTPVSSVACGFQHGDEAIVPAA